MENFRNIAKLICFIGFLDLLAVSMIMPLIATRSKQLGASPLLVGLIGSIYGAVQLFSSPIIGSWSDKKGRKFVLIFSLLTSAFDYFLLGCSSLLILLIMSRVLTGLFKHSQSLSQAYLSNIMSHEQRGIFYGYFTASSNIGFIVGPACGGHLAELPNGFFLVTTTASAIFVLNAVIAWMFLPKIEHRKTFLKSGSLSNEKKHSTVHDDTSLLSLGKRYFAGFQLGDSWDIMLLRFVLGFSTLVFRSSFSLVLEEKFEFTPKYVGYLTSYQGGVSTIAGFLVGHLTLLDSNEIHQTFIGILALFLALSGLTISTTVFSLVCSLTLLCIATSFLRVCLSNLLSSRCSKEKMGAVFGLGQSVTSVARMLAPVAGGLALELGPHGPGLVGAVSSGIGLLCCCLFLKSSKQKTN